MTTLFTHSKTILLLLMTSILMCIGCSWEELTDSPEMRKAYLQKNKYCEAQDSASSDDKDSTYVLRANHKGTERKDSVVQDSLQCDLYFEGKLIVDGGSTSDISDTYVTVEKIKVNVCTDGKETVTYYPEINIEVAEPSEFFDWDTMPSGINYERKKLSKKPLTILYEDYFYAKVIVVYILRIKDTKLFAGQLLGNGLIRIHHS